MSTTNSGPRVLTAGGASLTSFQKPSSSSTRSSPNSVSSSSSSSGTGEKSLSDGGGGRRSGTMENGGLPPLPNDDDIHNHRLNRPPPFATEGPARTSATGLSNSAELLSYDSDEGAEEQFLLDSHHDKEAQIDDLYATDDDNGDDGDGDVDGNNDNGDDFVTSKANFFWLGICFFGIMLSFVGYGLLLEYATSGGRKLHELSFLFVTSLLYTCTAAAGRHVRDETPTTIPPARFAVLGITSMGSTFCSVRSLRYVIFPIQVLAKSCKPVPVMIMGAFMGKKYPLRKYGNVCLIVAGVGLFMGGGNASSKISSGSGDDLSSPSQIIGIILLFISLCFDGGTGAYEDKLMSVHSVGPFDLMYNIQLGKTIIAGVSLLVLNQVHVFLKMCQDMGFVLVALGLTGAMGQVFIFVTISKFGALTCSIIGLARKVTTLVASIYIYGHHLNAVQMTGLVVCVSAMVMNFMGKADKKGGGHGHGGGHATGPTVKEPITEARYRDDIAQKSGVIELPSVKPITAGGL